MIAYMTMIEEPDHLLLFEQILNTYKTSMFRKAYSVLKDYHWAEDAVSEAFFKIAKNMKKISSLSSLEMERYLVIICRNCALDIARQHHLKETPIDFIEELENTAVSVSVEEAAIFEENYMRLIQAIEELEHQYRDVMQMYYLYDHKTSEIAEIFGIKENTVHARLSRGRKKLAEILAEKMEGSEL